MTRVHDFSKKLATSRGARAASDAETLAGMFSGVSDVVPSSETMDRAGVDYIVHYKNGGETFVDVKTREPGASRFWKHGEPDLALELWSVRPNGKYAMPKDRARKGWPLDTTKKCHYVLFTFAEADCADVFLLPFMQLRQAFYDNHKQWVQWFPRKLQDSGSWESECLFVPVGVVIDAINTVQRGRFVDATRQLRLGGSAAS